MMIEWEDKVRRRASWPTRITIASLLALSIINLVASIAWAHGGRTGADGCHNDRKNGGRHCHGGAAPKPQRASGAIYYPNCAAARAAGAAPLYRGDPGYGRHLDRDGDGKACE